LTVSLLSLCRLLQAPTQINKMTLVSKNLMIFFTI